MKWIRELNSTEPGGQSVLANDDWLLNEAAYWTKS